MPLPKFQEISQSFISVFKNGRNTTGRVSRREFWLFYGSGYLVLLALSFGILIHYYGALKTTAVENYPQLHYSYTWLFLFSNSLTVLFQVMALPTMVRRFQDTDRKGLVCYAYVGLQLAALLLALTNHYNILIPPSVNVIFNRVAALPSIIMMFYVLFVCCLKGCEQRNTYGLPGLKSPQPSVV
ncbi:MAG: DUF805 domain-containing protein [Pseudomonadota bacterium]|nr:DUF805 domain-containing protein [Pseudomonadota bacterium]